MARAAKTTTLVVTVLFAGCASSQADDQPSAPAKKAEKQAAVVVESDEMAVVEERKRGLDVPYVAGNRAYGLGGGRRGEKLGAAINTNLISTLAPAAIRDPVGGRLLAYNSWRWRRPVIRLHDLNTNATSILDDGALSVAWRRDGALAYFKALRPDVRSIKRYFGHVVVRSSLHAAPGRWTTEPGRYVVAAWAGESLVVYRIKKSWPDLLVVDAGRRVRVLAESSGLVAVSPDGRRAFVMRYGASPPVVRVLDVRTGEEVASFTFSKELDPETGEPVTWVANSGSWVGDLVAAPATRGVAVFRISSDEIVLEQLLRFDPDSFPLGAFEPHLDNTGRSVVIWAEMFARPRQAIPPAAVLVCDRVDHQCIQGPPAPSFAGPRLVYNPSRP